MVRMAASRGIFTKIGRALGDSFLFCANINVLPGGEGTRESLLIPAQAAPAEIIVGQTVPRDTVRRDVVPRDGTVAAEAVSSLELERSVFDSSETEILSAAFAKAWAYVEFDPTLGMLETSERQSELARCLMAILKLGDCNPTSIANSAIVLMRRNQSRTLRTGIATGLGHPRREAVAR
jgi:hypothetical protein